MIHCRYRALKGPPQWTASSLSGQRPVFDAFQKQHHPQPDSCALDIAAAGRRFDVGRDPAPCRPFATIGRQVARFAGS